MKRKIEISVLLVAMAGLICTSEQAKAEEATWESLEHEPAGTLHME